jgi:hypothetical protein
MAVSNRSDTSQVLQSSHQDYILNLAFDHYGRRIAVSPLVLNREREYLNDNHVFFPSIFWCDLQRNCYFHVLFFLIQSLIIIFSPKDMCGRSYHQDLGIG